MTRRTDPPRPSRRLPIAAFLVAALGLVAAVLLLDRSARMGARRRAAAELDAVGALKVTVLVSWTEEQLRNAALAAGYPSVARAVAEAEAGKLEPDTREHVREILGNLAEHYGYLRIGLLDAAGRPLLEWAKPGEPEEPFPPSLARAAAVSAGGAATSLSSVAGRDRPVLLAAAASHKVLGPTAVVAVRVPMEGIFDASIQSWPIPSTSATSGLVQPLPDGALLYSNLGAVPGNVRAIHVPRSAGQVPAARAAAGELGLVEGVDAIGHPVLANIRAIPGSDWKLVTKIDVAEVDQVAWQLLAVTVSLALIALLAGGFLLAVWWRHDADRWRMEAQLRDSRDLFRLALAGTHFLWDLDLDAGRLLYDRAGGDQNTTGSVGREVVEGNLGTILTRIVHPDDIAEVRKRIEAHVGGESELFEAEYRTLVGAKGDGPRWVTARGRGSRRDAEGRAHRITGVVSDVTSQRTLRAQLEHSERLASLGTLAAGVAHEINNPLSYVLANLEYAAPRLQAAGVDAGVLEALSEAEDGATRVRDVVRGLRAFSRPGAGPRGPVDVKEEIEAAIRLARNEIRHRARLELRLDPMPAVICASHELGQVFLNVLVNAAQAIPEGRAKEHTIAVEARTDASGWARVEVRDTGCGIPPEVVKRVFEPFFTTKARGAGTGLGLAIAQGIVGSCGGRIEVESEVGKGTTVRVLLPPAPDHEPVAPRAAGAGPEGRLRLLVVDDDPMVARVLGRSLGEEHEVVLTGSAAEALVRIQRGERFDAIFCDVMMPQMSGTELHQRVAAGHPELARRMIFITGGAFTEGAASALTGLPNPCLTKPFQAAQLRAALERVAAEAAG